MSECDVCGGPGEVLTGRMCPDTGYVEGACFCERHSKEELLREMKGKYDNPDNVQRN